MQNEIEQRLISVIKDEKTFGDILTKNISEEDFKKDKLIQDAVIRRLEIIGEASRNIPRSLKEKNEHVPWFQMCQFRDFIVHSYFEASLAKIWKTTKEDIKLIKESISRIVLV